MTDSRVEPERCGETGFLYANHTGAPYSYRCPGCPDCQPTSAPDGARLSEDTVATTHAERRVAGPVDRESGPLPTRPEDEGRPNLSKDEWPVVLEAARARAETAEKELEEAKRDRKLWMERADEARRLGEEAVANVYRQAEAELAQARSRETELAEALRRITTEQVNVTTWQETNEGLDHLRQVARQALDRYSPSSDD